MLVNKVSNNPPTLTANYVAKFNVIYNCTCRNVCVHLSITEVREVLATYKVYPYFDHHALCCSDLATYYLYSACYNSTER